MTVNNSLTTVERFKDNKPKEYAAFLEDGMKIVTLPANTRLFKLSQFDVSDDPQRNPVSPWWSYVVPTADDEEGAAGRFVQSVMNGISFTAMVRYMSAVKIDWNYLTQYVEIKLKEDTKAVYGKFSSQVWISEENESDMGEWLEKEEADLPAHYGVLPAWQLYIPDLYLVTKEGHGVNIEKVKTMDLNAQGGKKDPDAAAYLKTTTTDDLYISLLTHYATTEVGDPGNRTTQGTIHTVDQNTKKFVKHQ
jgi:hypothetical protein